MSQQLRTSDETTLFDSSPDETRANSSSSLERREALEKAQLEARSRMISFRVTAEEFERFRSLCTQRGFRNVSEVVRLAVNQLLTSQASHLPDASGISLLSRVCQLEARLDLIEAHVKSA